MDELPSELRFEILKYLIPTDCLFECDGSSSTLKSVRFYKPTIKRSHLPCCGSGKDCAPKFEPGIATVSKKWASDCQNVLYARNRFRVSCLVSVRVLVQIIGDANAGFIKYLDFEDDLLDPQSNANRLIGLVDEERFSRFTNLQVFRLDGGASTINHDLSHHLACDVAAFNGGVWHCDRLKTVRSLVMFLGPLKDGTVYCDERLGIITICGQDVTYRPGRHDVEVSVARNIVCRRGHHYISIEPKLERAGNERSEAE